MTGVWRDGSSLFGVWTERFPNYSLAHSSLGVILIGQGDPAGAIGPLRRALKLTERSTEAHFNLGVALVMTSKDPEVLGDALVHLRRAIELSPDLTPAWVNAYPAWASR